MKRPLLTEPSAVSIQQLLPARVFPQRIAIEREADIYWMLEYVEGP